MEIIKYGNPLLRKRAKSVDKIDRKIKDLVEEMLNVMQNSTPRGVGLAAPQIGISLQIIVIEISPNKPISLINPTIIENRGKEVGLEGCLSIPGVFGNVERAKIIKVRGINPHTSKKVLLQVDGMEARAIQHEVDHLNGILFTDYIERIEDLSIDDGFSLPEKLIKYFKEKK